MPSLEEHNKIDLDNGLPRSYPEVHNLLDQFAHWPDMLFLRNHRKFLHHKEGVEYIKMRFGEIAAKSAEGHILADCGHIPNAVDYYNGTVDNFGFLR